jgi:hypothetical protein
MSAGGFPRIPLSPTIAADAADLLRSGRANVFGADSGVGKVCGAKLLGRGAQFIFWEGSAKRDFKQFPEAVQKATRGSAARL